MLVMAALVGISEFALAATFLGTCTRKSRSFPTYYNVHITRLVALLLTLDTCLRDDSLTIHYTISLLGYKCAFP